MAQEKKKWGDRKDGVWLKDIPAMNRIMPSLMPNRADNEAFVSVEIDIRPYLDDMLEHGLADGYFDAQTLSELCINGMNLGWETIGTFDHTMEMRNLRLDSYID